MFVVKFILMDLLFICVFNAVLLGVDEARTVWIVPLELFTVKCLVYALCSLLLIVVWPAPTLSSGELTDTVAGVVDKLATKIDRLLLLLRVKAPNAAAAHGEAHTEVTLDKVFPEEEQEGRDRLAGREESSSGSAGDDTEAVLAEISDMTTELNNAMVKLRDMAVDIKYERWVNETVIESHIQLVEDVEEMAQKMQGMVESYGHGFNPRISLKIVQPMASVFEELRQALQVRFAATVDLVRLAPTPEPNFVPLEDKGLEELKVICEKVASEYHKIVSQFENETNIEVSPTPEVARMNFFLWRLLYIRKSLKKLAGHSQALAVATRETFPSSPSDSGWKQQTARVLKSRAYAFALPAVEIWQALSWWAALVSSTLTLRSSSPYFIEFVGRAKEWAERRHWLFGLRIAVGLASLSAFGLFATNKIDTDIRAAWSGLTFIFVSQPSLGATINKGMQRAVGTLFGAVAGQLIREVIDLIGASPHLSAWILLTSAGLFGFGSSFFQHSVERPRHYSFIVALYAYQVILLAGVTSASSILSSGGWITAFLRCAHVVIGDVYSTLIGLVFSDRSTTILLSAVEDILVNVIQVVPKLVLHSPTQILRNDDPTLQSLLPALKARKSTLRSLLIECRQELLLRPSLHSVLLALVEGLELITDRLVTLAAIVGKSGWSPHHTAFIVPCIALFDQLQTLLLGDIEHLRQFVGSLQKKPPRQARSADVETGSYTQAPPVDGGDVSTSLDRMAALVREIDEARVQIVSSTRRQRTWHDFTNSELVRWNAFLYVIRDIVAVWSKLRQPTSHKVQ